MFASKTRAYPRETPASISLGWKGLTGTNNLAYYKHL